MRHAKCMNLNKPPAAEGNLRTRLLAAALAIKSNCERHGRNKSGTCGICPFYSKDKIPHCLLTMSPPSEWPIEYKDE